MRSFGGIAEQRPILQKGDNFTVPERREKQRYVSEFLKGDGGQPARGATGCAVRAARNRRPARLRPSRRFSVPCFFAICASQHAAALRGIR